MSKKLKKRIRELCGLDSLPREERLKRCQYLLTDNQFKQQACNKVIGLSFKDIDKVLNDEIADRKPITEEQEIYDEIREEYPDKLEYVSKMNDRGIIKNFSTSHYTAEEIQQLMKATDRIIQEPKTYTKYHDTYSFQEVAALHACDYDPVYFKKPHRSDR